MPVGPGAPLGPGGPARPMTPEPLTPRGPGKHAAPAPAPAQSSPWPKGGKVFFFPWSPRGYFGRNRRRRLETAQPMRQKAIQGLLSRFRWSRTTSIFDGFWADLNRALSALFSKFRPQKIDSETLRKVWIFDPDPTGFDSDLPEPGEPLYRF